MSTQKACISPAELKPGQVAWGLYDRFAKAWLGNDNGPQLYVDGEFNGKPYTGHEMARVGATIIGKRMEWDCFRLSARQYDENANKIKDEIFPALTADQAMKELNDGHL